MPYSLKFGDRYYSYVNLGPLRLPFALIGQLGDFFRYDSGKSQNWIWDLAAAELWAGVGSVMHDNFLQGMNTLLTALSAAKGAEAKHQVQSFVATFASSAEMLPAYISKAQGSEL
jgi:hypothetical protein